MKKTPTTLALAYAAGAVAIILIVGMLVQTRSSTELIESCTIKPAGRCAQIQREQMAGFVRLLAVTAACADKPGHQTAKEIQRCVDRQADKTPRTETHP